MESFALSPKVTGDREKIIHSHIFEVFILGSQRFNAKKYFFVLIQFFFCETKQFFLF